MRQWTMASFHGNGDCQSGSWAQQASGVGWWKFKIPGDPYNLTQLGIGGYNRTLGTFSGEFKCDAQTVSSIWGTAWGNACGSKGPIYCGSNQYCAYYGSFPGNGPPTYNGYYLVTVNDLVVANVSPL